VSDRIVAVQIEHLRSLVAQHELDGTELERLQPGGVAEHVAELHVLGGRERLQHRPLLEQLPLHLFGAREDLEAGREPIGPHVRNRGPQLVHQQLHPQLRSLVLDDEQHLVVVLRARLLRGEQQVEAQVAAVGGLGGEVGVESGFAHGAGPRAAS
jgi:hypothetical protein